MSVYIYFRNRRWAIKCPYCRNANKVTARRDGRTLFCGNCQNEIKLRHSIRKGEDIRWVMKQEKKDD